MHKQSILTYSGPRLVTGTATVACRISVKNFVTIILNCFLQYISLYDVNTP
jgi:hypothetical protein